MTSVERSLSNINIASGNIAAYMAQCEKHADRTRKVLMSTVVSCVLVIAGTLWWSMHVRDTLTKDRKEIAALEALLNDAPVAIKVNGVPYIRIVEGTETSQFENQEGKPVKGRYAKVWHAS